MPIIELKMGSAGRLQTLRLDCMNSGLCLELSQLPESQGSVLVRLPPVGLSSVLVPIIALPARIGVEHRRFSIFGLH